MYSDSVKLSEDVIQIASREGSLELSTYSNTVYGYRVNIDGCWRIVSSNDKETLERIKQQVMSIQVEECGDLAEAKLYRGSIEIGKEYPELDELMKIVNGLCSEAKGYNVLRCEILVLLRTVRKLIEREDNDFANELRRIVEVEVGLISRTSYGLTVFASNHSIFISWNSKEVIKFVDSLFKETMNKLMSMSGLKPLKPYMYGKNTVILDHVASAALFHEVSHLLDATYVYSTRIVGSRLCSDEVEVYDDPHNAESPSIRFFDDEGVVTKKRSLIENGVVRDLHHTRFTARVAGSEPGSAYGLFYNPVPFHTTLVIKPSDWRYDEVLEDTKKGLYIVGVSMATLEEGYIRLIPEHGYIIENGELKEAVKIREVRFPLASLKTINAITRDTKVRTSYEKSWPVSEVAPMIRLEAFVQ